MGFAGCWIALVSLIHGGVTHNVDVSPVRNFSADGSRFFGYRVRQINSSTGERILVGDPGSGLVRSCDVIRERCDIIALPDQNSTRHVGITLEVEPHSQHGIVCGSNLPHYCDKNSYVSGACYTMDASLTPSSKLNPGYQECEKGEADLCVLIDSSASVGQPEERSLKCFLKNTINALKNTTVNLAIVQYSQRARTELDFRQYQDFRNLSAVIDNIKLLRYTTKTFQGISHTLYHIFTESAGHRPRAKKVLLIVTDGDNTDEDNGVTERADRMGVVRYLVGLGANFKNTTTEENDLASQPAANHTWKLDNYAALENLFAELQLKILAIEGSAQGSHFIRELSSSGLSAALAQGQQLLGDPGIYDWSGGVLEVSETEKLINITLHDDDQYGYLGYDVSLLRLPDGYLYLAGAPRYQYLGLVTVFRASEDEDRWMKIQNISGEQVGSYFGSEIEVSDVNLDDVSDLVLIAAPHFYDMRESGRVSVYGVMKGGSLDFQVNLHGEAGHPHSQFGAAISTLGDLDGDGLSEVAVGAPYEADGRGALYIYRGKPGGLWPEYSQRLLGPSGSLGFGLSIHGVLDMTQDGLTDVAVGSFGQVTLHRSRPLLRLHVTVTSLTPEIPIPIMEGAQCEGEAVLLTCVEPTIMTTNYTGTLNVSLRSSITLDFGRVSNRMFFTDQQRDIVEVLRIQDSKSLCRNHTILPKDCTLEDSSPVSVSFQVLQVPDESQWLLSPLSTLIHTLEIPFQLCSKGGSCESNLLFSLRTEKLVVKYGTTFSMFISLQNDGDSAQRVVLRTTYPQGLSFQKANITKASRRMMLACEETVPQSLTCNVSHPILRLGSWADILLMFGYMQNISWPERVQLNVSVTSDNAADSSNRSSARSLEIPVLHPINVIARSLESSTKYLQLSKAQKQSNASHVYQIQNLGASKVPAQFMIHVSTPAVVSGSLHWSHCLTIQVSRGNCTLLHPPEDPKGGCPEPPPKAPSNKTFLCSLEIHGHAELRVSGVLRAAHAWEVETSESLPTTVAIEYNQSRFHSSLGGKFHNVTVVTRVDLVVVPNYLWHIVGSAIGGLFLLIIIVTLLFKCGFFRRYRMEEGQEKEDPDGAGTQEPLQPNGRGEEGGATEMSPQSLSSEGVKGT